MDKTIQAVVNARTAAYNAGLSSGNMRDYKASCYALRSTVKAAKLRYRERVESQFQLKESRRTWQGLRTISAFRSNPSSVVRADSWLADELNIFCAHFKTNRVSDILPISVSERSRHVSDDHVITVTEDEVRRTLKRVNVGKAPGPDSIMNVPSTTAEEIQAFTSNPESFLFGNNRKCTNVFQCGMGTTLIRPEKLCRE